MASYSVKCWEDEHTPYVVLMVICIFVYVIGIPAASVAWLRCNRRLIQNDTKSEAGQLFRETYGQLFASYDARHYYFEGVEMIKKMILAGGLVLVAPGSSVQILVGILVAFAFFATVLQLKPYEDATDNKLQAFATAQIIMTLLAGLVIQTDVTGEYQENVMSVLLIIINGSVVVLGLVSTALMLPVKCCYGRSRVLQNRLLGALKKLDIFKDLPERNVKKIARCMQLKCYSEIGTEIFAQGAKADSMLVIARGTVSIVINGTEKRKMKAPEVLGEKVLVENQQHQRAATAICASKSVEMFYLRRKDYDNLVDEGIVDAQVVERVRRGSERWSSSPASSTKVTPSIGNSQEIKNQLAEVRAQYGASSSEYMEAAKSVTAVPATV